MHRPGIFLEKPFSCKMQDQGRKHEHPWPHQAPKFFLIIPQEFSLSTWDLREGRNKNKASHKNRLPSLQSKNQERDHHRGYLSHSLRTTIFLWLVRKLCQLDCAIRKQIISRQCHLD